MKKRQWCWLLALGIGNLICFIYQGVMLCIDGSMWHLVFLINAVALILLVPSILEGYDRNNVKQAKENK